MKELSSLACVVSQPKKLGKWCHEATTATVQRTSAPEPLGDFCQSTGPGAVLAPQLEGHFNAALGNLLRGLRGIRNGSTATAFRRKGLGLRFVRAGPARPGSRLSPSHLQTRPGPLRILRGGKWETLRAFSTKKRVRALRSSRTAESRASAAPSWTRPSTSAPKEGQTRKELIISEGCVALGTRSSVRVQTAAT